MDKRFRSAVRTLLAAVSLAGLVSASVAATDSALEKCSDPRVDRTACLREAAAAQEAKRQGQLTSTGGYDENALARCQRQPVEAREACVKRVQGTGNTTIRGSVLGGGKIRRTETPVPAPAN
ncbi:hypothetical protein QTI24_27285 [Variovorax sp. J22P240]|uniref:hypothetical protein n=1 Tax=Variovorax sp. J22P240 TaxID=3053514 RepID=UPI0025770F41|nr:hypothetical protein [Variovorax sp. J22P240]MDM0002334.1 hypothetical protein [Variovorax sp. J22P240]